MGAIEGAKKDVASEACGLPDAFEWSELEISNRETALEVQTLLSENYVEDSEAMFRFDYSADFIQWAVGAGSVGLSDWTVGVRVKASGRLVGFISAVPCQMLLSSDSVGKSIKVAEVNFLCVHKKLRSKRLAPVLIREITRRVNLKKIWQAVYTAGSLLPTPIAGAQYYHRALNLKKLVDIGFMGIPSHSSLAREVKLQKLPETMILGFKKMEKKHCKQVHALLREYLKKFPVHPEFTHEETAHWLLPREGVVSTWVLEKDSKVTDFISYYSLPSSVLKQIDPTKLKAAYLFYHSANSVSLEILINQALLLAIDEGYDVFNALDIMDNQSVFGSLKFGKGDGLLHYYAYNWRIGNQGRVASKDIGLVLM